MNEIIIRAMKPEESRETLRLARRSFPFFYRLFIWGFRTVEVAVENGKIISGAAWHTFKAGALHFGYLAFGFTDKRSRGLGLGRKTYTQAIEKMKLSGVDNIGALVLCDNTASWKLIADNGFVRASARQLLSIYGLTGTVKIWFESAFIFSPGAELWVSDLQEKQKSSLSELLLFITLNAIMALLHGVYLHRRVELVSAAFVAALCVLKIFLSWMFTLGSGIDFRFKFWRSGGVIPLIVFLSGGLYPLGGDFYPAAERWNYNDVRKKLGLIGLGGWLAPLIAGGFLLCIKYLYPESADAYSGAVPWVYMMLFFNILPFLLESWSGARVWKWNRPVFILMTVISVAVLFFIFWG